MQEFNHDKETVRSLQIWMTPDRKGHTPQYGSNRYTAEDRHNRLLLILGGSKEVPSWNGVALGKGIKLHQVFTHVQAPWHICTCLLNRQSLLPNYVLSICCMSRLGYMKGRLAIDISNRSPNSNKGRNHVLSEQTCFTSTVSTELSVSALEGAFQH